MRVSFGSLHHVSHAGTRETHIFSTAGRQNHKLDGAECVTASVHGDCLLFASSLHAIEDRGNAGISDSQGPALRFYRQERTFGLSSLL